MGTQGREMVKMDVDTLIEMLNKAFADEWLAYYQYWIGAQVAMGQAKTAVVAELMEHAGEELEHAQMLADRIMQLEGHLLLEPKMWYEFANCGYHAPTDYHTDKILTQNIAGEQCAIKVYQKILDATKDTDVITHDLILQIQKDEIKHEQDLQALFDDMQ